MNVHCIIIMSYCLTMSFQAVDLLLVLYFTVQDYICTLYIVAYTPVLYTFQFVHSTIEIVLLYIILVLYTLVLYTLVYCTLQQYILLLLLTHMYSVNCTASVMQVTPTSQHITQVIVASHATIANSYDVTKNAQTYVMYTMLLNCVRKGGFSAALPKWDNLITRFAHTSALKKEFS